MTTRQKVILGGLGALTPLFLNLLVVDYTVVFEGLTMPVLLGYLIRVVVLFILGGIVAYLHKTESNRLKLFELGIVAPALITAMMNGANANLPDLHSQGIPTGGAILNIFPAAYAQANKQPQYILTSVATQLDTTEAALSQIPVRKFQAPEESFFEKIQRGLTGRDRRSQKIWYVIVGSYKDVKNAKREALHINSTMKGFHADVYESLKDSTDYEVVIGSQLTLERATELLNIAKRAGFGTKGYTWSFR